MRIKLLGAHNLESESSRLVSLLIDDILAIDAGSLTSGLSFAAQQRLKAVILTHQHYDHIRDIAALSINLYSHGDTIEVYSIQVVYDTLASYVLNDILYPNFLERPPENPTIKFHTLETGKTELIAGYSVLPVTVTHVVDTIGLQITSTEGKKIFFTSDTGPGLTECWQQISPDLLITEVTTCNGNEDFARNSGHLTPNLLQQELESFRNLKGYLPQIVLVHMTPMQEKEIKSEIAAVAKNLNAEIRLGYEGMQIEL